MLLVSPPTLEFRVTAVPLVAHIIVAIIRIVKFRAHLLLLRRRAVIMASVFGAILW